FFLGTQLQFEIAIRTNIGASQLRLEIISSQGVLLGWSNYFPCGAGLWNYWEIKVNTINGAQRVTFRVNGVMDTVNNPGVSLTPQGTGINRIGFSLNSRQGAYGCHIDDLYILSTGGSFNPDYLGPVVVQG